MHHHYSGFRDIATRRDMLYLLESTCGMSRVSCCGFLTWSALHLPDPLWAELEIDRTSSELDEIYSDHVHEDCSTGENCVMGNFEHKNSEWHCNPNETLPDSQKE